MWKKLLSVLLIAALLTAYAQPTAGALSGDADADVCGAWSTAGHTALADAIADLADADVIKAVSKACDTRVYLQSHPANSGIANAADYVYKGCAGYHAIGNYVAAARYLYEFAQRYQYGTPMNAAAYDTAMTGMGQPYEATIRQDIDSDIQYMAQYCKSLMPAATQQQRLSAAAFGILFHLLGDIYAHRTIVPVSAVSATDRTSYGSGEGGNEDRYFVLNDFRTECPVHGSAVSGGDAYRAHRHELFESAMQALNEGFFPFALSFAKFLFYAVFGLILSVGQTHSFTSKDDQQLLQIATSVSMYAGDFCDGQPCFCTMRRLAQMGILQFKDVKYFLNDDNYKTALAYYEDRAPDGTFYASRYETARAVIRQFAIDFNAGKAFDPKNFLPIYTEQMRAYHLRLDRLYNYIKTTNKSLDAQTCPILRASWWQNRDDSLFDYTTIVYNGAYLIDPSTYPAGEKPLYSTVFPDIGKRATDFYS